MEKGESMDLDSPTPRGMKRKADEAQLPEPPRRIKALSQDVVNKIAAGEIIVAPAQALKELIENAVDAGSTSLDIAVKEGGLKLLQITDNGHGIAREDLEILCERFTTSKLKDFEDLMSIGTYGFRGEALASISHIAHLTVTTRTKESSCAWRAHYSGGKLVSPKPGQTAEPKAIAGRIGTIITVEDLFYNVPTRRRAFRSASEEYAKILDFVGRYAVHCAGVSFSCKKHGDASMSISVPAKASIIDRIRAIHGSAVANELIEFEAADDRWGFSSKGWISSANYSVKKTTILLFINGRAVESSAIKKATEHTYSAFLPKGGRPFAYISLEIDPQRVDVNVHPTKREVNFLNEDEIIEQICDEIRTRLGKVDTSRTFMTQSLLPGAKIPTITSASLNEPYTNENNGSATDAQLQKAASRRTTTQKPYENNLIRTDSRVRKITSMLPTSTQNPGTDPGLDAEREPVLCRLTSVKELRAAVRASLHSGLTDLFATHTFVGVVDCRRRVAAVQGGVKLYLVDYGLLCCEFFYQVGLADFGNFGAIRLDPPLDLEELLRIGTAREREAAADDDDAGDIDWDEVVRRVHRQLVDRRDMLAEYFSLEISTEGGGARARLASLPLLARGYTPPLAKLPAFLLRLGPHVDWADERACFHSFLRELAAFYTPEALPVAGGSAPAEPPAPAPDAGEGGGAAAGAGAEGAGEGGGGGGGEAARRRQAGRRAHVERALENVLFPAFKARLVATKGMLRGVVEVADLKGLYRVFERC